MHPQDFLSIFHGFIIVLLYGPCMGQRRGGTPAVDFNCPEEFGYYPHPNDCTQYYVCVFGGAVLESCTGGLMYSHELQTCDWPRNVGCGGGGGGGGDAAVSTVRVTDPRTAQPRHLNRTPTQRDEGSRNRQSYQILQEPERAVYEDELGPAQEVEDDRQQRVYRGQPATQGQVARDRDGLNAIPLDKSRLHHEKYGWTTDEGPHTKDNTLTHERTRRQANHRFAGDERRRPVPVILIPSSGRHGHSIGYRGPAKGPAAHASYSYNSHNHDSYQIIHQPPQQYRAPYKPSLVLSLIPAANASKPNLDLLRLTKETIQTAFRPLGHYGTNRQPLLHLAIVPSLSTWQAKPTPQDNLWTTESTTPSIPSSSFSSHKRKKLSSLTVSSNISTSAKGPTDVTLDPTFSSQKINGPRVTTSISPYPSKKDIPEEFYDNFSPFPTSLYGKRQSIRKTTTMTTGTDLIVTLTTATPPNFRVEQVPAVTPRYNSSARVQPTPYDQYYQLYEQEPEIYRTQQFSEERPSSTVKSPVQQYRGPSIYEKQPQEQAIYSGNVYSQQQTVVSNDYNDEADEQQFQQLASPKPNRSEEAERKDTMPQSSMTRTILTNKTKYNFDTSILSPPPRILPSPLTPPSHQQKIFLEQPSTLTANYISKDNQVRSHYNDALLSVNRPSGSTLKISAPQTILRSEIGRIEHQPVVERSNISRIKAPVPFQEMPEKDFEAFFVEIEPRKQNGFYVTKPPEEVTSKEPVVEITKELLLGPESAEALGLRTSGIESQPPLDHNVDALPLRAPSIRFNPSVDELEFIKGIENPNGGAKSAASRRPEAITAPTNTQRLISNVRPYEFIIVSTAPPTPFTRNPENEHRTGSQNAFKPESRLLEKFSDERDNKKENLNLLVPKTTENYWGMQGVPSRGTGGHGRLKIEDETGLLPQSEFIDHSHEPQEENNYQKDAANKGLNNIDTGLTAISNDQNESVNRDANLEASRKPIVVDDLGGYSTKNYTARGNNENNVKQTTRGRKTSLIREKLTNTPSENHSASQETSTSIPLDKTSYESVEITESTKRPIFRIRTTTEHDSSELRLKTKPTSTYNRGDLRIQRLNPKVKRIHKPATTSTEEPDSNENAISTTLRPIIVDHDLDHAKNTSFFRFTIENDHEYMIVNKIVETIPDTPETRIVRPAYQPINLDNLESAEEPIPPRPSTEPSSPKPSRVPDHERVTTKPVRGRASLKPRLRASTAPPDSSVTVTSSRQRGGSSYNGVVASGETSPSKSTSRGTRPTLKPSTAIVSKATEFVDVYRYPPSRPENLYATPTPDKTAAKCRKDVCLLPDCSCGGKDIPGGYSAEEIPQLVLLTFDDSVNDLNKGLYADLFERGRVNPNGCPISGTFYVSHEWTDYSQVQNLYANGHEIASHSVSHSFGEQFSHKKWTREIAGQREILAAYGGVRLEDVRGMRAPFLAVGGNKMFKMLHDANFTYDSSMPIYENKPPSWPYTLDYKLFHDCMIPPCPTKSYPGLWEVPMVMWQDLNGGRCSMGDACSNPPTADGVYKMLIKNFERHFTTNRAPFGLFYHAAWFTHPHHKEGFIAFLDTIVNMPEVWLVNNWQAIQWVRDPQPLQTVQNFPPFQCNEEKAKKCNNPKVCNLWHKSGVRYMRTCQPCPDVYPWTGKTGVRNSRVDNEIQDD